MNQTFSILFGLVVCYLVSFFLVWLFTFIYFTFTKKGRFSSKPILYYAAILALYNMAVTLASIAFLTINLILFILLSSFLIVLGNYYIMLLKYKFTKKDAIIISAGLSIILNPAWLIIFGLI